MPKRMRFIPFCALLLSLACNQPFDPRAPLEQQMVLYSVLSTDRNAQFVRVYLNYMPSDFDPSAYTTDNAVKDALVSIADPSKTYQLRDTLLSRPDTSRYKFPIHMYVLRPFIPLYGRTYNILAQSPSLGTVSASVVVPAKPKLSMALGANVILDNPRLRPPDLPITFLVQLSDIAKGYIARLFIYYDVLKGSEWVEERIEIPITSADSTSYSMDLPLYPRMTASTSTSQLGIVYRTGYYRGVIGRLTFTTYATNKIMYKWLVLVLLQAEKNLFSYYSSVHGYQDPWSIRLDEPVYSGVNGGVGIVGAYTLDSLVYPLPENFFGNR